MNNWCICWFSRIVLLGILIFKGLNARRFYKSFGVKGLIPFPACYAVWRCHPFIRWAGLSRIQTNVIRTPGVRAIWKFGAGLPCVSLKRFSLKFGICFSRKLIFIYRCFCLSKETVGWQTSASRRSEGRAELCILLTKEETQRKSIG
jgi:hypothetical protein